ncbi:MerR family transcriptional regulator [Actinophytocola sediminis]
MLSWSTRQLAEEAGVTLRAVRHYHEIGLLDEPERRTNGHKRYTTVHLARLLRIRRLVELGFSLDRVRELLREGAPADSELSELDDELAVTITLLQRRREEIAAVRRCGTSPDTARELAALAPARPAQHQDRDRDLMALITHLYEPAGLREFGAVLSRHRESVVWPNEAVENLPADADPDQIAEVAEQMVAEMSPLVRGVDSAPAREPGGSDDPERLFVDALREWYNPAQSEAILQARRKLDIGFPLPPRKP